MGYDGVNVAIHARISCHGNIERTSAAEKAWKDFLEEIEELSKQEKYNDIDITVSGGSI